MDRRSFIKAAGLTSVLATLPTAFQIRAGQAGFEGKFLITIQVSGGWDVSSLCDPKMNIPGEAQTNHWAQNDEIRTAGNIQYAPFATNQSFFEKYHNGSLGYNLQNSFRILLLTRYIKPLKDFTHKTLLKLLKENGKDSLENIAFVNDLLEYETSKIKNINAIT